MRPVKSVPIRARNSKSECTRRRILDETAAIFSERGYPSVTLADIAEAAGLKAGSLYYHFASKEELVEEILTIGVENTYSASLHAVAALGAGADPVAKLRAAFAAHMGLVLEGSNYVSANVRILRQVPESIRKRILRRQRRYGAFWHELFAEAEEAGLIRPGLDLSVVRMLAFGAMNWSVDWYRKDGRLAPAQIAAHLSTMLLDGLLSE
jgi:AcrR family transcriptional regulator